MRSRSGEAPGSLRVVFSLAKLAGFLAKDIETKV
jgi:hypothetical protein